MNRRNWAAVLARHHEDVVLVVHESVGPEGESSVDGRPSDDGLEIGFSPSARTTDLRSRRLGASVNACSSWRDTMGMGVPAEPRWNR